MQNEVILVDQDESKDEKPIDWKAVNKKIDQLKESSIEYLEKAINE